MAHIPPYITDMGMKAFCWRYFCLGPYLKDQMNHKIRAIYHIALKSQNGMWILDPFHGHVVLQVRPPLLPPESCRQGSVCAEATEVATLKAPAARVQPGWGGVGGVWRRQS